MTPYRIVATPQLGWCIVCGLSWTPDMIAVLPRPDVPRICGACILAMAQAVKDEQARRDGDRIAQRGGCAQ